MGEAGGGLVTDGKARRTLRERRALKNFKTHLNDGTFAFRVRRGRRWGGEAFGTQKAAMVHRRRNWITGAMSADYPGVKYQVAELPAGPGGKGTLQFTNCWAWPPTAATRIRRARSSST